MPRLYIGTAYCPTHHHQLSRVAQPSHTRGAQLALQRSGEALRGVDVCPASLVQRPGWNRNGWLAYHRPFAVSASRIDNCQSTSSPHVFGHPGLTLQDPASLPASPPFLSRLHLGFDRVSYSSSGFLVYPPPPPWAASIHRPIEKHHHGRARMLLFSSHASQATAAMQGLAR